MFFNHEETPWEPVEPGIKRKIIGYTEDLMAVEVCFEKGAEGKPHSHEIHDQIGYVVSGSFEALIDGKKKILRKGDAYLAAKLVEHGAVALEENSVLLDVFSPVRKDFLN